tara:strand:- start:6001 stop:6225 length:225 start_codon:yes stop_codon:yes gene_type:complete
VDLNKHSSVTFVIQVDQNDFDKIEGVKNVFSYQTANMTYVVAELINCEKKFGALWMIGLKFFDPAVERHINSGR